MTKDEAMKMALEALELYQSKMSVDMFDVAIAVLRTALEQPDVIEAAVLAEREACAKVADRISDKYAFGYYGNEVDTADEISAAIRERMK